MLLVLLVLPLLLAPLAARRRESTAVLLMARRGEADLPSRPTPQVLTKKPLLTSWTPTPPLPLPPNSVVFLRCFFSFSFSSDFPGETSNLKNYHYSEASTYNFLTTCSTRVTPCDGISSHHMAMSFRGFIFALCSLCFSTIFAFLWKAID